MRDNLTTKQSRWKSISKSRDWRINSNLEGDLGKSPNKPLEKSQMRNGTEKSQSEENVHDLIKGKLDIKHHKKTNKNVI